MIPFEKLGPQQLIWLNMIRDLIDETELRMDRNDANSPLIDDEQFYYQFVTGERPRES
jgi:hypothetical protein